MSYPRHNIPKTLIHTVQAAPAYEHRHVSPVNQLGSLKDDEDQEMDTQYLHRNQSQPGQHRGCQLYQPDHLQVRPVPATDLDIGYKVSATYLELNVPSILLDIRAQTMQRLHKKTSVLQFIAVLGHDMAKIEQLGINLPRVGPEKWQKENRYNEIVSPLIAMVLVLLHPLQPVSCIGTSLVCTRDSITRSVVYGGSTDSIKTLSTVTNQNQSVLIFPENLLENRHLRHYPDSNTTHHPGHVQTDPDTPQYMMFLLPSNSSQTVPATREPKEDQQNIVQTVAREDDKEPATGDEPLHTVNINWPQVTPGINISQTAVGIIFSPYLIKHEMHPVQTQQLLSANCVVTSITDVHEHLVKNEKQESSQATILLSLGMLAWSKLTPVKVKFSLLGW